MRKLAAMLFPRAALTALTLTLFSPVAWAQTSPPAALPPAPAAPAQPPPGYAPPPAGYAPPPAGYAPPPAGYPLPTPGYTYAVPPGYGPPPGYAYGYPAPQGPAILPYEDGDPVPAGYRHETRFRTGLIIAGAATFGAVYTLTAIGASTGRGNDALFVPVLGPFIEIGQLESSPFTGFAAFVLVIDGLAQTAGAAMLIGGLANKKHVLVRQDVAKTATVRLTPLTMGYKGAGVGFGLVGTM